MSGGEQPGDGDPARDGVDAPGTDPSVGERNGNAPADEKRASGDSDRDERTARGQSEAAAARTVDPEAFALRGRPTPAIRFRSEIVIGCAFLAAAGLAAVIWFAMRPSIFAPGSERPPDLRASTVPPDVLAQAPESYDAVPVLGPPLPGDLGRAIVARQRNAGTALPGDGGARRAEEAAEAERRRAAEAVLAARKSQVLIPLGGRSGHALSAPPHGDAVNPQSGAGQGASSSAQVAPAVSTPDASVHRIVPAPSPWIISGGSILAASLLTGINSDTSGLVVAQITQNAHDSVTGRVLLIPQGARVIGTYDGEIAFGARRVSIVWHRIVWPDGSSLRLDDLPASDAQGQAGLADRVDVHTGQLARGVLLSTLLGVGTEIGFGSDESELVRALREAGQQSGARAGDRLVGRALDIAPTIRIRPGWPLRIVVHRDLLLQPWRP